MIMLMFQIFILVLVIVASIKFGFTRNFIFGIIRTVIGIAGAVGACAGVFLLMDKFGWLDYLADAVVGFFGNPDWMLNANPDNLRIVARIIAYVPFAILFLILGYLAMYWLINLLVKLIFLPVFVGLKKVKGIKIVDNVLGLILNLGLYLGVVFAIFGFVHAMNTVETADGFASDHVSFIIFGETGDSEQGGEPVYDFLASTIDNFVGPTLNKWHESFSASPIGSVLYEYNPLNGLIEGIVESMFATE